MLESLSLPGAVTMPRLRWARKDVADPKTAAHLAVAFDTFASRVVPEANGAPASGPFRAFGLFSFFEREYASVPAPVWRSAVPPAKDGERHPSERWHTDRLVRLQGVLQKAVARHVGAENGSPVLRTEVSPEKADSLTELHRLCDWVITLDRNAGIEYFDSPQDNKDVYDAYVIDCVPEREDLGCLQLITSTANREEVRNLLDASLDRMGLSRSRRNAEFLLEQLKALSGRLAIRLTGNKPPTAELIALAVSYAHCRRPAQDSLCWVSLEDGFIVPVDDVLDLLPPLRADGDEKGARPDLIFVSTAPRKGLVFRFIEVKYRRHLRAAREPAVLRKIDEQVRSLRERWRVWYHHEDVCAPFRAVRRAKLARVLRFYADKARRHHLSGERYKEITSEIDRMIEKGGSYAFPSGQEGDRGWVFCPEYAGGQPLDISPNGWATRVFLFGPGLLPDSDFRARTSPALPERPEPKPAVRAASAPDAAGDARSHAGTAGDRSPAEQARVSPERADDPAAVPSIRFGTDTATDADVRWPLTVKANPHLLVAGLPGMGKTTCLLNVCTQMIAAQVRPIVFSYHQDIDERLDHAVEGVRFIDFDGLGFNPLQVVDQQSRTAYLDVAAICS